jgi:Trk K+ transport system NAD-binding subunit
MIALCGLFLALVLGVLVGSHPRAKELSKSLMGLTDLLLAGFDRDPVAVRIHQEADRNVLLADATDSDFWERVKVKENIDLVVLAMPKHGANVHAAKTLKRHNFEGVVTATGKFDDEVKELRELGLDTAFNLYNEAGAGFADHVVQVFSQQRPDLASVWRKPLLEADS